MIKKILTDFAAKPIGPYNQAIIAGDFLFTSGQGALTKENQLVSSTITEQAKQTMENLQAILFEAEIDFSSVVKTTCYLKNMDDFHPFNEIYKQYFRNEPTRTCVAVKELPLDILCEVELIAYIPTEKGV